MQTLAEINTLNCASFVASFGQIYEESPWVAELAHKSSPFKSVTALAGAMRAAVDSVDQDQQVALLNSYPDLAGKLAVSHGLTADSALEHQAAGLDRLSPAEHQQFTSANDAYRAKNGFPFILAVRNATKETILEELTGPRLTTNTRAAEKAQAIAQVHKIAWMRLISSVEVAPTGYLTCQVLDTANGCPAAGMRVTLARREATATIDVGDWVTNSNGQFNEGPAIGQGGLTAGQYEWSFYAGDYYAKASVITAGQPTLDVITLGLRIYNPEEHYHLPLLVSPWSYSISHGRQMPFQASL